MRSLPAVACLLLCATLLVGCTTEKETVPDQAGSVSSAWRESGAPDKTEYVALGDSYVAAPGVPETDVNNPCFPSTNNYPALVAIGLEVDHLIDASCGGASTEDLTDSQGPGRQAQFDALSAKTTLVTITIGGNDNGVFASLVTDCIAVATTDPAGAPCRTIREGDDSMSLLKRVDATAVSLDKALAKIPELAPNALVVVVGYPRMFPESGTCPDLIPLAAGDYAYASELSERFSQALKKSARNHGLEYVDMLELSQGHNICADDPWVNGAIDQPGRAAAFHPFAVEQAAAAAAIVKVVNQQR